MARPLSYIPLHNGDHEIDEANIFRNKAPIAYGGPVSQPPPRRRQPKKFDHILHFFMALLLSLDIALLPANTWVILNIEKYASERGFFYSSYETIYAVILLTSIFVVMLFIDRRILPLFRIQNKCKGEKYDIIQHFLVILVEFSIALLIFLYFWRSALPVFKTLKWDFTVDPNYSWPPHGVHPAVSILSFDAKGDAASANLDSSSKECAFPDWTGNCTEAVSELSLFESTYGILQQYQYNGTSAIRPFNNLSDELVLKTWITWNSENIKNDYKTDSPQNPYVFVALWDSRFDLELIVRCHIVALTEIPALGSTTLTITAEEVTDELGIQNLPDKECAEIFHSDPPYIRYQYSIASTGSSYGSVCDQALHSDPETCMTQVIIRYATFLTSRVKSVHGIEPVEIWVNEGAIIGAVLIIGYFAVVFNGIIT